MLQMQQGSATGQNITAMLEVPRSVVLQQGLPEAALEGGGGAQTILHQMGIAGEHNEMR